MMRQALGMTMLYAMCYLILYQHSKQVVVSIVLYAFIDGKPKYWDFDDIATIEEFEQQIEQLYADDPKSYIIIFISDIWQLHL